MMWHFEGRTTHPRERVLPGASFELIVHLRGRYGMVRGDGVQRCAEASISGMQTRPFVIQAPEAESTVVGIQFTPAGAWRVFGVSSRMAPSTDLDPAEPCAGKAIYTSIPAHLAWIEESSGIDLTPSEERCALDFRGRPIAL